MFDLPLRLLNLWGRIRDYVTAVLFVLFLLSSAGWCVAHHKIQVEKVGRKNDALLYENAQKEAKIIAYKEKARIEKESYEKATEADANYDALRRKYADSLLRLQRSQGKSGPASVPRSASAPKSSDGPSEGTILPDSVVIPFKDAEICAENTARLEAVQKWATQ